MPRKDPKYLRQERHAPAAAPRKRKAMARPAKMVPRLNLRVIKAIIGKVLGRLRAEMSKPDDGMNRLIAALRKSGRSGKARKAG